MRSNWRCGTKRVSTSRSTTPKFVGIFSSAPLTGGAPHPCASPAQGWDLFFVRHIVDEVFHVEHFVQVILYVLIYIYIGPI
jgi:hypothetical protein